MIVYALADQHGDLPEIPECDLLLIAGDICPDFMQGSLRHGILDKGEQRQRAWLDKQFRAWLDEIPAKEVVAIAGNHDFVFEHKFLIPELRWHYLEDSEVEIGGVRVWGTPWVPNLPSWAFYGSPNMLSVRAGAIPEGVDILLSHGPPYGYGDGIPGAMFIDGEIRPGIDHVGEAELLANIKRIAPQHVICGHIHEAYGSFDYEGIPIHNVSVKDALYRLVNPIVKIELDKPYSSV